MITTAEKKQIQKQAQDIKAWDYKVSAKIAGYTNVKDRVV